MGVKHEESRLLVIHADPSKAEIWVSDLYPEIVYIISSFSTLESEISYSGIKYILLLAQSRDPIVFHGPALAPIGCPIKKGHPQKRYQQGLYRGSPGC